MRVKLKKFKKTASGSDLKLSNRALIKNVEAVRESFAKSPENLIRGRRKELDISRTSLTPILTKDLHLLAKKVYLNYTD